MEWNKKLIKLIVKNGKYWKLSPINSHVRKIGRLATKPSRVACAANKSYRSMSNTSWVLAKLN